MNKVRGKIGSETRESVLALASADNNFRKSLISFCHSERSEESGFVPAQAETQIPRSARDDRSRTSGRQIAD